VVHGAQPVDGPHHGDLHEDRDGDITVTHRVPDLQPQLQPDHVPGTPTLVVPARVGATDGTNSVPVPISLYDTNTNQDRCEGVTFNFVYAGTANYTDTTTTALTSSPNPSASGSSVTFVATVVPTGTPPSNPTGTVNFYQCATAACSGTPTLLGSGSLAHTARPSTRPQASRSGPTSSRRSTKVPRLTSRAARRTPSPRWSSPRSPPPRCSPRLPTRRVWWDCGLLRNGGQVLRDWNPTGTVNFYKCATSACSGTPDLLGSGTLHSGKATYSTSGLPVGSTYVEAVYEGVTGSFSASTSNVVTQVVTIVATTTVLTSAPTRRCLVGLWSSPQRWPSPLDWNPDRDREPLHLHVGNELQLTDLDRLRDAPFGEGHVLHLRPPSR